LPAPVVAAIGAFPRLTYAGPSIPPPTPARSDSVNNQTPTQLPHPTAIDRLLLTTEQAAEVLGVGRTTVYALIKDGQLRPVHIGRSCRLSSAELQRYVERLETPPSPAAPLRPTH
jgi:excisionase family DNA binding protein